MSEETPEIPEPKKPVPTDAEARKFVADLMAKAKANKRPATPPAPEKIPERLTGVQADRLLAAIFGDKPRAPKKEGEASIPEADDEFLKRLFSHPRRNELPKKDPVELPPAPASIGLAQEQNNRPYQEDRVYAVETSPLSTSQARKFLATTVGKMHLATKDNCTNGSTFTGAVITNDVQLVTAHLGDSPAVLIMVDTKTQAVETKLLTKPHTPSFTEKIIYEDEQVKYYDKKRNRYYENKNGDYSRIALSRALGDATYGEHVSKTPDIRTYNVAARIPEGKRAFLLVATDGIIRWRKGSGDGGLKQSVDNVAGMLGGILKEHPEYTMDQTTKTLLTEMMKQGKSGDNITLSLTEVEPKKSKIIGMLDGHGGKDTVLAALDVFENEVDTQLTRNGRVKS